jgi:GNAT superfamily N-acetyltransferase
VITSAPFFKKEENAMLELATLADRPAVNNLARQVHELHVDWRPDIFRMPEELYPEGRYLDCIRQRQLYVAKLNGIVAGFVLLKIKEYDFPGVVRRTVMVIDEICVEKALRGDGVGTRIMEEIHALARAFGCTDLQLGVYPQNDDAVGFYQKCGFTIRSIDMQRKV